MAAESRLSLYEETISKKLGNLMEEVEEIARTGVNPEPAKITIIKNIVNDELLPDLKATRLSSVNQIATNLEAIKTCNKHGVETQQKIAGSTEVAVGSARSTHTACRTEEKNKKSTKEGRCKELDDFLNNIAVPQSMPEPKVRDQMVPYVQKMSDYFCPKGPTVTKLDKACKTAEKEHAEHKASCDKNQAAFEMAFCQWRCQITDTCATLDQCYNGALTIHNNYVAETKILEKKWKIEYSSLKKIICYTNVWLTDNKVSSENLQKCQSSTVDTSPMDITYPDIPEKAQCVTTKVDIYPGSTAFPTTEYKNFLDFSVSVIPCTGSPAPPPPPTVQPSCKDPSKPTNLVQNGGFDKEMASWKCYHKPGDYIKNDCHAHRNFWGHDVTGHLHGHCHHGTQGGIEQTVATKAGTRYKLKFVAFEGDWDGDDVDSVWVKIDNSDKSEWTVFKVQSPKSNDGWKTLTVDFTANGPTTIIFWADKNHCIDVDDVQLLSCAGVQPVVRR